MYYGYNNEKELILADEAFIELLGFQSFQELSASNIMNSLRFENKQIVINQNYQSIHANFTQHEVYGKEETFYLVELENIKITEGTKNYSEKGLKTYYEPIYLDVAKISSEIGLTIYDYKLYLDSFIDQSIIDEKRLIEGNDKVVKNLSNLALTLKIPHINILLLKIQKLSQRERMPLIDEYYTKLALLTLDKPENHTEEEIENIFEEDKGDMKNQEALLNERFSDLLKNIDDKKESIEELVLDERNETSTKKVANNLTEQMLTPNPETKKIILENAPELPISYSPQTAADELNLPVVLIEEFVDDFIEQARQDKDHLLTSYYQKDMDNIHELGHKLKGAASNLRINELSDILEEIQFCSDYEKLEALFIKYWGHFLSLESYMKQLKRT